ASQVRRACSLVHLATLPVLHSRASLFSCFASSPSLLAHASCKLAELLTRASLLSCFASSPSLLAHASCNLAGSAHLSEFIFILPKFAEAARSCFFQPRQDCSTVRSYTHASQVHRACSLVLFATSPNLLTHFAFILPNFPEPARSCFLQPRTDCSTVRIYFDVCQVRRACSLLLLATTSGLLTRESILSGFASSPSLLARASCNLAGSAQPCEFIFMFRKFAEFASSCFLQTCGAAHPCEFTLMLCKFADASRWCFMEPCRVRSPVRVYYHASSAHPCEFIFMLPKFNERAISCFCRPWQVCSLVRVYFHASQVRRSCSLVLLANSPGQLTRASLLSGFASSPSLLARASCNPAGSAQPCEFTFILRKFFEPLARASCNLARTAQPFEFTFMLPKFAEPPRPCFLQPCRVCSLVRVYFHASQVRRSCSLVLLATWPVLLSRANLLSYFESSSSLLARASCNLAVSAHPCEFSRVSSNLAGSAHSCEFTLLLRKFVEPALMCFLQPCRICSDVRIYFHALQDRQAWSLVLLATSPDLFTHASLLSFFPTSPFLL
ncbi:hypothetical protein CRG98_047978, partial [Punica granatum]